MARIRENLTQANVQETKEFFAALYLRLGRQVSRVLVVPLYGRINEFASIESAIQFLDGHRTYEGSGEFRKYEVYVEFSNGDKVQAFLDSKQRVREFLEFVSRQ